MKGSSIYAQLPAGPQGLMPAILQAVQAGGLMDPIFAPVTVTGGGHTVTVWVATDALRLGEPGDSFRPMVSPMLEQIIADSLGLYLPTAKIVRACYQQAALKVAPKTQFPDQASRVKAGQSPDMADKAAMLQHSHEVDAGAGAAPGGYVPDSRRLYSSGKNWVNSKRLKTEGGDADSGMAINHGWYDTGAPYVDVKQVHLWQNLGGRHNIGTNLQTNPGHYDYSQTASELVYPWIQVDGSNWMDFDAGLRDPSIAQALSDDGALSTSRPYVVGTPTAMPTLPRPDERPSPLVTGLAGAAVLSVMVLGLLLAAGAVTLR
jgi:hypothetical protein